MPSDKVLGYILLFIGLAVIIVSTVLAFGALTGKSGPPKIFDIEAPTINIPSQVPEGATLPQGSATSSGFKILPDDVFSRLLNSSIFFLAMMFVASSGAKIATIGVQLIKEIKVSVKEEKLSPPSTS